MTEADEVAAAVCRALERSRNDPEPIFRITEGQREALRHVLRKEHRVR